MNFRTACLAVAAFAGTASGGLAETFGGIGLGFGTTYSREISDFGDENTAVTATIAGEIGTRVAERWVLGLAGTYRRDERDYSCTDCFEADEDPQQQYTLALHALYDLSDTTRIGGFLDYGRAIPRDAPTSNEYDYVLVGAQAQHFVTDSLLMFGQIGLGDKVGNGQDSTEGFNDGIALRAGAVHLLPRDSYLRGDIEFAATHSYIDGDDRGRFLGASVEYGRRLGANSPLYLTAGLNLARFDSTTENDDLHDIEAMVGLRWTFGNTAYRDRWAKGIEIGTPRLPVRASGWTETLD